MVLVAAIIALTAFAVQCIIVTLTWVNPPTTAFMLRTDGDIAYRWSPIDAVDPSLGRAVIASEDQRFYDHHGVDVTAIREAIGEYRDGESLRGASTLTQQVAKNLFLSPARDLSRKAIEAYLAVLIDAAWSKRRILEIYLNIAQFDDLVFGCQAASLHYFGLPPAQLSEPQAALLAATLPSPGRLNPARPSEYLRERQQWILEQMNPPP